jgi:hypothetical protein
MAGWSILVNNLINGQWILRQNNPWAPMKNIQNALLMHQLNLTQINPKFQLVWLG